MPPKNSNHAIRGGLTNNSLVYEEKVTTKYSSSLTITVRTIQWLYKNGFVPKWTSKSTMYMVLIDGNDFYASQLYPCITCEKFQSLFPKYRFDLFTNDYKYNLSILAIAKDYHLAPALAFVNIPDFSSKCDKKETKRKIEKTKKERLPGYYANKKDNS